ncbi:CC0125/CC1285 family lipoprotein [Dongia deserti]|uniref:CC0125/CC1285 family lipoprotein n=1 Tax=Dongia deserti TaxID=2268030 RepID=UPI0013C4BD1E|nr:hypothetical protein [Dongia deserti]
MYRTHTNSVSTVKLFAAVISAVLVAACTTPPPPKPAMVPLGQIGEFGYSARDLGPDRIEVTYTGPDIRVSSSKGSDDPRVKADQAKIHDLALWRAAQIADERGYAAMRIENETRDTDVEVTRQYVQRIAPYRPYWGPHWGHPYYWRGPGWFYDDPFYYDSVRRAHAQSVITLKVQLLEKYDPNDETQLSVNDTLARLRSERAGAVY